MSDADKPWSTVEYDTAWAPFVKEFAFKADYYERTGPAIAVPGNALVIDLAPIFAAKGARFAAGEAAVNAAALRAFVWIVGDNELTALDWQHESYRWSPSLHALSDLTELVVPVFPNGDYFIHHADDLAWGTFGHPWQQSLTIWGQPLVESLGAELLTWLPARITNESID